MEYLPDNFIIYILVCRILYLALEKDIWVYPILEVMNWTYRIVFFVLLWCFFLLLYKTGELITIKFWGELLLRNSSWSTCADFGHNLRCKNFLPNLNPGNWGQNVTTTQSLTSCHLILSIVKLWIDHDFVNCCVFGFFCCHLKKMTPKNSWL